MNRSTAHTTSPRLFVEAPLRDGAEIAASPAQAHYLGTVLRRGSGDEVRLFNGIDGEWLARLIVSRRDRANLTVIEPLRPQSAEPGPWLVFALLKRDATDLVVRQSIELGASRILPVLTERTNTAHVNEDRLRAIAIEAAEQSERLTVPPIESPTRLNAVLAEWPTERRLFVALERFEARPLSWPGLAHTATEGCNPTALLIGPEGGFSQDERTSLQRMPFVIPISLGLNILRAETAAAAGLALLPAMGWAEYDGST